MILNDTNQAGNYLRKITKHQPSLAVLWLVADDMEWSTFAMGYRHAAYRTAIELLAYEDRVRQSFPSMWE